MVTFEPPIGDLMPAQPFVITPDTFLDDRQGRTFTDIATDPEIPFAEILEFFADDHRQRRMEEAEIDHDRPALAGVVRELESHPAVNTFMEGQPQSRAKRLRQAIGVLVRMIMTGRGWEKTGRKGSLGVRAWTGSHSKAPGGHHNTGGLALWFRRAERYAPKDGLPYENVKVRAASLPTTSRESSSTN